MFRQKRENRNKLNLLSYIDKQYGMHDQYHAVNMIFDLLESRLKIFYKLCLQLVFVSTTKFVIKCLTRFVC